MSPVRLFRPLRRKRLKRATWPGGPNQTTYFLALLPGLIISAVLAGDLARHTAATGTTRASGRPARVIRVRS
jgi:hypothetical protein